MKLLLLDPVRPEEYQQEKMIKPMKSSRSSSLSSSTMLPSMANSTLNLKSTKNPSITTTITYTNKIIEVDCRYLAWISMLLGFLFIWSSVISLIFIANKLDECRSMQKPMESFLEQESLGRIMFSVGQEMLFTVDSLVSIQLNLSDAQELSKSVNFTWDLTDDDIEDVKSLMDNPSNDFTMMIASIENKLESIRSNLSLSTNHPLTMIDSYRLIFDISEHYTVGKNLLTSTSTDSKWPLIRAFTEIQNAPYSLFIKGMNRRFIELAYGTIYHIGPQLFNKTDVETEVSNYFYYFYSSHELIENAFSWDPRIYHRYMELLRNKHSNILQTSQSNMNVYRLSGKEYTRFVTDVVTYLLRAKDVLNVFLKELLMDLTSKNPTMLYAVISSIYLFVLILSAAFFLIFIWNAKIKDQRKSENGLTTPATNRLNVNYSDGAQIQYEVLNPNRYYHYGGSTNTINQQQQQPSMLINSISNGRVGSYEPIPIII